MKTSHDNIKQLNKKEILTLSIYAVVVGVIFVLIMLPVINKAEVIPQATIINDHEPSLFNVIDIEGSYQNDSIIYLNSSSGDSSFIVDPQYILHNLDWRTIDFNISLTNIKYDSSREVYYYDSESTSPASDYLNATSESILFQQLIWYQEDMEINLTSIDIFGKGDGIFEIGILRSNTSFLDFDSDPIVNSIDWIEEFHSSLSDDFHPIHIDLNKTIELRNYGNLFLTIRSKESSDYFQWKYGDKDSSVGYFAHSYSYNTSSNSDLPLSITKNFYLNATFNAISQRSIGLKLNGAIVSFINDSQMSCSVYSYTSSPSLFQYSSFMDFSFIQTGYSLVSSEIYFLTSIYDFLFETDPRIENISTTLYMISNDKSHVYYNISFDISGLALDFYKNISIYIVNELGICSELYHNGEPVFTKSINGTSEGVNPSDMDGHWEGVFKYDSKYISILSSDSSLDVDENNTLVDWYWIPIGVVISSLVSVALALTFRKH